jgi:hypothetical protein
MTNSMMAQASRSNLKKKRVTNEFNHSKIYSCDIESKIGESKLPVADLCPALLIL